MQNRVTFASALAVIVPVLLVLIAVVVLARRSDNVQPAPSTLAPTSAAVAQSAGQAPAMDAPTAAPAPVATPAPKPRPSGPVAPGFDRAVNPLV